MAATALCVAVFGDSVMEGQGLLDKDKFTTKASQEIGRVLGRPVDMVVNTARSGAPIRAAGTAAEEKKKRAEFVNTYPSLFHSAKLRTDFIEEDIQEVAFLLTPELPATFPTISYQVRRMGERFSESTRRSIELVILGGGANDLDFQEYLNPENHRDDYIKFYEDKFEEYFNRRAKALIINARQLFPNAVIVYTGLYTPFLPDVSNGAVKDLFEDESGKPGWQIWLNNNIIEIKNVDQLVLEAQYRSQHGLTRGLYWMRRTIAEVNEDPKLRGPGVLFVHPQFARENTVFESNSFIHKEYDLDKVNDAVRSVRENLCPRNQFREEMEAVLFQLTVATEPQLDKEKIRTLMEKLGGPTSLLNAFQVVIDEPSSLNRANAIKLIAEDLKRIYNARRASFLHPNEKGAQRYTDMIVRRYKERYRQIRFREDLLKLQASSSPTQTISVKVSMNRYGFRAPLSMRSITQHMEIDSIRLDVTTASDSEKSFIDELILDMGGKNRWVLTTLVKPTQPRLIPGTTDTFTVDAMGVHLGSLRHFIIERRFVGPEIFREVGPDILKPTRIILHVNGKVVFDVPFFGNLPRDGKLTFNYPR
jgi:hypothetical protein